MDTIYDYFKNFDKIETSLLKIEREVMKLEDFIVFRVFRKRIQEENWQYVGMTYLEPATMNKVVDKSTPLYTHPKEDFMVRVHETPTLKIYIRVIQTLLTNYLKAEIHRYQNASSKNLNRKISK